MMTEKLKMMNKVFQILVLILFVGHFGCGSDSTGSGEGWDISTQNKDTEVDRDDVKEEITENRCREENQPRCRMSCGSDVVELAECRSCEWVCPGTSTPTSECPEDTCWGPSPRCDETCHGVDHGPGASPECVDGEYQCPGQTFVRSRRCASVQSCQIETSMTGIEGIRINFPGECSWSLEEVRSGIEIPYEVIVTKPVENVIPETNSACGAKHPSGLVFQQGEPVQITGDENTYCPNCRYGLCGGNKEWEPRTLQPGTYRGTLQWGGRNWMGPSDYGAEKGDYFPSGTYEFVFRVTGQVGPEDSRKDFKIEKQLTIELTE